MTEKLQFGLIGCGSIGSRLDIAHPGPFALTHASAILKHANCTLAALCDSNAEFLAQAGEHRGVTARYADYHTMFKTEHLDAISLCTPPKERIAIIEAALAAGIKYIWCEKPLASSLQETLTIAALIKQHQATCLVNLPRRFSPMTARIERYLYDGSLGTLQSVSASYSKGLMNNGSHVIDFVMRLLGSPTLARAIGAIADGRTEDPTVTAALEFNNGHGRPVLMLLNAVDHNAYSLMEWHFYFTKGVVRVTVNGRVQTNYAATQDQTFPDYHFISEMPTQQYEDGFDNLFEQALENLISGEKIKSSVEDSVALMEVLAAIQNHQQGDQCIAH